VGGVFEKETVGSIVTYTHYVGGDGSSAVAIYKAIDSTTDSELTRYLHRDHLGSVSTVTNSGGTVEEQLSFDAWGQRRYDDWTAGVPAGPFETTRGFTGHEMLDDVGIIHMNGRIYDPDTGRFLSADPTVQFADNAQNLNRYSYVLNNPLSFTDPTGYFLSGVFKGIENAVSGIVNGVGKVLNGVARGLNKALNKITGGNQILNIIIVAVVSFYTGGLAADSALFNFGAITTEGKSCCLTAASITTAEIVGGALGGAVAGAMLGGDLKSAAIGGFTGAAFTGSSVYFGNKWNIQRVFVEGSIGGASSELQGGKFFNGFKIVSLAATARAGYEMAKDYTDKLAGRADR